MTFHLTTTYIHKSMMLPCVPFNVVFGHAAILTDNVFFYDHEHLQVHDGTMHAI